MFKYRAFSLIGVLIVIALIGVLSAFLTKEKKPLVEPMSLQLVDIQEIIQQKKEQINQHVKKNRIMPFTIEYFFQNEADMEGVSVTLKSNKMLQRGSADWYIFKANILDGIHRETIFFYAEQDMMDMSKVNWSCKVVASRHGQPVSHRYLESFCS